MSDASLSGARSVGLMDLLRPAPEEPDFGAILAERETAAFAAGEAMGRADMVAALAARESELLDDVRRATEASSQAAALATEAVAAIEAAFRDCLADLSVALARSVLASEPAVSAETLRSLADEAVAGLRDVDGGILRVAPEHEPLLEAACLAGWRLVADPAMEPGVVRAEVGAATSGASLARRLDQLAARMSA